MFKLINAVQKTNAGFTVSLMRIGMGWILFTEGSGKLWGWFHGPGIASTIAFYDHLHVPFSPFHGYIVGCIEFICGILFLAGLFTRLAAVPVLCSQIGFIVIIAYLSQDLHNAHMLSMTISLVLLQEGAGPLSLDRLMAPDQKVG